MPLVYRRDDLQRRVSLSIEGQVPLSDLIRAVEQFFENGVWTFRTLIDRRSATPFCANDTLRLSDAVRQFARRFGRPGRIAILVQTQADFGQARLLSLLVGDAGVEMDVFTDRRRAERWLDESIDEPA
jgi:hypothetical protein